MCACWMSKSYNVMVIDSNGDVVPLPPAAAQERTTFTNMLIPADCPQPLNTLRHLRAQFPESYITLKYVSSVQVNGCRRNSGTEHVLYSANALHLCVDFTPSDCNLSVWTAQCLGLFILTEMRNKCISISTVHTAANNVIMAGGQGCP